MTASLSLSVASNILDVRAPPQIPPGKRCYPKGMRLFLLALPVVLLAQAPQPAPQEAPKPEVSAPAAPGLATDD